MGWQPDWITNCLHSYFTDFDASLPRQPPLEWPQGHTNSPRASPLLLTRTNRISGQSHHRLGNARRVDRNYAEHDDRSMPARAAGQLGVDGTMVGATSAGTAA